MAHGDADYTQESSQLSMYTAEATPIDAGCRPLMPTRPSMYDTSEAAQALRSDLARQRMPSGRLSSGGAGPTQQPHGAEPPEGQVSPKRQQHQEEQMQQQGGLEDWSVSEEHGARHLGSPESAGDATRAVLVGWMAEVATSLGLSAATLSTSVELMDAFMERQLQPPPPKMLQLLALTCVHVAVQQEEASRQLPREEVLRLAVEPDTGAPLYEAADFRCMEWLLLETLEWRTLLPTPYNFVRRLMHCLETDPCIVRVMYGEEVAVPDAAAMCRLQLLAHFLVELALPCGALKSFHRSTVATACVVLALQLSPPRRAASPAGSVQGGSPLGLTPCDGTGPNSIAAAGGAPSAPAPSSSFPWSMSMSPSPSPLPSLAGGALSPSPATPSAGPQVGPLALDGSSPSSSSSSSLPHHRLASSLAGALGLELELLAPGLAQSLDVLCGLYGSAVHWYGQFRCAGGQQLTEAAGRAEVPPPPSWLSAVILDRHNEALSLLIGLW